MRQSEPTSIRPVNEPLRRRVATGTISCRSSVHLSWICDNKRCMVSRVGPSASFSSSVLVAMTSVGVVVCTSMAMHTLFTFRKHITLSSQLCWTGLQTALGPKTNNNNNKNYYYSLGKEPSPGSMYKVVSTIHTYTHLHTALFSTGNNQT